MLHRLTLFLSVFLCATAALAQATVPNTPAGRALGAWLDAFNSGDRARIDGFVKAYGPTLSGAFTSPQFRGRSGGVTLAAVTRSDRTSVAFRVQEKSHPTMLIGRIEVTSAKSRTISAFTLREVPKDAVPEDITLDSALRKQIIEDIATNLNQFYVFPDSAQKMVDALHAHESRGDYNAVTDGDAFASVLTTHLRDVTHDKHLQVFYNPYKLTADPPSVTFDQVQEDRKAMARDCGFRKLEILPNNIGYVKFDFFPDMMACGLTAAAALSFVANTDAVIFDLRDNSGGDPRTVAFICSYFFDKPTHLNDFYDRTENKTSEYWTMRYVPGIRLGKKPAYVLTSSHTFSGAEEFAYDMKNLKRATLVGETTAGGSHPVSPHPAGEHFIVYVPNARSINPITRTDWEGTGVAPDIAVKANDALEVARAIATEKIQENAGRAIGGDASAANNKRTADPVHEQPF